MPRIDSSQYPDNVGEPHNAVPGRILVRAEQLHADPAMVKKAPASPKDGLAITGQIIVKTQPRREVFVVGAIEPSLQFPRSIDCGHHLTVGDPLQGSRAGTRIE